MESKSISGTDHELGTDAKESITVGPNGQEKLCQQG